MAYHRQELFPGIFEGSDRILECNRLKSYDLANIPNRLRQQIQQSSFPHGSFSRSTDLRNLVSATMIVRSYKLQSWSSSPNSFLLKWVSYPPALD